MSSEFCGSLRFNATNLEKIVNTNAGEVGICAIYHTARKLTSFLGERFRGPDYTVKCSSEVGDSCFSVRTTGALTTGNIGICVCGRLRPAPYLSCTVEGFRSSNNVVLATSRGPTGCGNCGYCSCGNCRVASRRTTRACRCVRGISCFANVGSVSFSRTISGNLVRCVSRSIVRSFLSRIRGRYICPRVYGGTSLDIVCAPLGNANGGPIERVLGHVNIRGVCVIPRRRVPGNGFPAYPCPGPRVERTFRLTLGTTGRVGPSVLLTASPSYSEINVTIPGGGNSCALVDNGRINTVLLGCLLSRHGTGNALPRGTITIGSFISASLTRRVTGGCGYAFGGLLANFGCVNRLVAGLRTRNETSSFVVNFRRSCNCLTNARTESGSTIINSVLVYRVTTCCGLRNGSLLSIVRSVCGRFSCCDGIIGDCRFSNRTNVGGVISVVSSLHRGPPTRFTKSPIICVNSCGADVTGGLRGNARDGVSLPGSGILTCGATTNGNIVIHPDNARPGVGTCVATVTSDRGTTGTLTSRLVTSTSGFVTWDVLSFTCGGGEAMCGCRWRGVNWGRDSGAYHTCNKRQAFHECFYTFYSLGTRSTGPRKLVSWDQVRTQHALQRANAFTIYFYGEGPSFTSQRRRGKCVGGRGRGRGRGQLHHTYTNCGHYYGCEGGGGKFTGTGRLYKPDGRTFAGYKHKVCFQCQPQQVWRLCERPHLRKRVYRT